jgi:hypothetical protein
VQSIIATILCKHICVFPRGKADWECLSGYMVTMATFICTALSTVRGLARRCVKQRLLHQACLHRTSEAHTLARRMSGVSGGVSF